MKLNDKTYTWTIYAIIVYVLTLDFFNVHDLKMRAVCNSICAIDGAVIALSLFLAYRAFVEKQKSFGWRMAILALLVGAHAWMYLPFNY